MLPGAAADVVPEEPNEKPAGCCVGAGKLNPDPTEGALDVLVLPNVKPPVV